MNRSVVCGLVAGTVLTVVSTARAQNLVLRLGEPQVAAPGRAVDTIAGERTRLPVISLGPMSPYTDRESSIPDSSVRRAAGAGGLEYTLAAPAVVSFSPGTGGGRRLEMSAPVVLTGPDGKSSFVYEVELTAEVPSGAAESGTPFPIAVQGWRSVGADRNRAFQGVLTGRLQQE